MPSKTPLESHEDLCAVRYSGIEDKLERVIAELCGVKNEISNLKEEMNMGKGAVKAVCWIGAVVTLVYSLLKLGKAI